MEYQSQALLARVKLADIGRGLQATGMNMQGPDDSNLDDTIEPVSQADSGAQSPSMEPTLDPGSAAHHVDSDFMASFPKVIGEFRIAG